ncbi:DoxX family membrane protein [Leptospira biflexa]|uniref:DoxX family membrane protein n=1 Tax=Leptospira biflexa TaxID=172 RepID=UPI0010823844|nr:DoxX family membrane protein [Leptospira biflexa]TGM38955.1 DoxX family membrane protein [Leptospira biflexa]TGM39893.1 DoxX family membrane protein [Leptospira biflexa]
MKILYIIVRTLLGALFLFSSIAVLFNLVQQPEMTGNIKIFNDGLKASGYLMTFIKVTELVCAIAFLTGRFVPLASVIIAPVVINIFMVHIMIAPEGIPVGIFVVVANAFLGYYNRSAFAALFVQVHKV